MILAKNGRILISVKSGAKEGFVENFLETGTKIYFSHFTQLEISKYLIDAGFRLISIEKGYLTQTKSMLTEFMQLPKRWIDLIARNKNQVRERLEAKY